MKKKNGVVLFVTLMMILLLMSVVSIFLNKTKESKDKVTTIFAMTQTNAVMHNLLAYLNTLEFDEFMIFYASQMAIPLNLGDSNIFFKLDSNQKNIGLNSLINASIKDNIISDQFIFLLLQYKIQNPEFFLDLLKDTVDIEKNDALEESRNASDSEIIIEYPIFRNGKIYNKIHLDMIIDYYFKETGDPEIYNFPFEKLFSFEDYPIDLNFISLEIMGILFEDLNGYTITTINENEFVYEEMEDVPFDAYYRKKIDKGILGQSFTTKTKFLKIQITLIYLEQFESKISFKYDITSKKISDYTIEDILLK
ncbi:hypothetical protein JHD48_06605 [Sulfurimonas sp. SAG-AH-194-I05]|nr:hypothetical protein [Sulfurimonas sp. SAG-AH-194-I05]MDF1875399.1 hypothetical protein [Sulfurimonas sp. SAG-AH-194-I05]